jgi:hypothetical protein
MSVISLVKFFLVRNCLYILKYQGGKCTLAWRRLPLTKTSARTEHYLYVCVNHSAQQVLCYAVNIFFYCSLFSVLCRLFYLYFI